MIRIFSILSFVIVCGLLSDGRSANLGAIQSDFNLSGYGSNPEQTEAAGFSSKWRSFNGSLSTNTVYDPNSPSISGKAVQ